MCFEEGIKESNKDQCVFIPLRQVVVLFCLFVCRVEISLTMCPLVICLVPSGRGVHKLCFVAFGPTVGKLLNFKVFV